MSQIYFFRHAQASYLADNYDKLSELGEKQSVILGKYLVENGYEWDKVYVGGLERQKRTLKLVREAYAQVGKSMPEEVVMSEWNEHAGTEAIKVAFMEVVAKSEEAAQLYKEMLEDEKTKKRNMLLVFKIFMELWSEEKIKVAGTESWAEFRARTVLGLGKVLKEAGKGEKVAVFTSGGAISSAVAETLGIVHEPKVVDINFSSRNTSFTQFLYSKQKLNLLSFNELPHLEKEMITFV